jgi:hypothetical protein
MREEHERAREGPFGHDPSSLPTLERCVSIFPRAAAGAAAGGVDRMAEERC